MDITHRKKAEDKLAKYRELKEKNAEPARAIKVFLGRELRIQEPETILGMKKR